MEFDELLAIRELLQYQHLIGAVTCLGKRSMRYSELGNAIAGWTGARVGDGEITRTVRRLQDSGLSEEEFVDGHRMLRLTETGRQRLRTYHALGRAVRYGDPDTDDGPPRGAGW